MTRTAASVRDTFGGLAVALLIAGCTIAHGPSGTLDFVVTPDAERTQQEFWEDATAHAGTAGVEVVAVPLPTWVSGRVASVGADGRSMTFSEFDYLDLGLVNLPWLPVWLSVDAIHWTAGGSLATSSTLWTPVFTRSSSVGWPADAPRFRAQGWPLLYDRVEYGTDRDEPLLELHHTLWTLGPSWGRFDLAGEPEPARGWMLMPLTLAGIGGLLWTSAELESRDKDLVAHGPLFGMLGYRTATRHAERESTRSLLGGILWYDVEERDAAGDALSARHGPLWGMFGWGASQGRPAIRVFWFPVVCHETPSPLSGRS